jgi:hypothetical protein
VRIFEDDDILEGDEAHDLPSFVVKGRKVRKEKVV